MRLDARARRWIGAIYIWVLPAALIALFQAFSGAPVTASFGNDNLFGLAMLLVMPPTIGLGLTTGNVTYRRAWFAAAAVIATAVVASQARAATAALIVEFGLCVGVLAPAAFPERFRATLRRSGMVVAGFVSIAALAVAVIGSAGPHAAPTWLAGAFGPTFATRAYIWSGAVRTFLASPIVGYGPLGYQFASQRFVQPELMVLERGGAFLTVTPAEPHSLVIRLLVAMGVLGVAAVGFAIWGWFRAIRHATPPSNGAAALRNSFVIATLGFALGSLFGPWLVTLGALPAVIIGLSAAGFGNEELLPETPQFVRWVAGAALATLFIGLAVSVAGEASGYTRSLAAESLESRSAFARESVAAAPYSLEARFNRLWTQGDSTSRGEGDRAPSRRPSTPMKW